MRLGNALLRHRAEIAERAARVEAEVASRVKSEFIANISHELRTPLNAVLGFSKLLHTAESDAIACARVAEYAHIIHDSAESLLGIINDVITISKIHSGKLQMTLASIHVDELIETIAAWARTRIGDGGIELVERVEDCLPPMRGSADEMTNVLHRLLDNAIKFTSPGGAVALVARRAPGGRIAIGVCDTGVGMSAEEIAVALKPFGQVDNRLNRRNEGPGLGLPIAKALVELQGGSLLLNSRRNHGTDALIVMPEWVETKAVSSPALAARGPRSCARALLAAAG